MRRLAAKAMPFVSGLTAARARRLGLAAGALAFGAALALGAHALKPDDAGVEAALPDPGGETVVSKFARTETKAAISAFSGLEPTPVNRLLAMALAPTLPQVLPHAGAPAKDAEPSLEGLSEIPRELIWNRPPGEETKAEPKAFAAFSKAREQLPWDAVEPVPFSPVAAASEQARPAAAKDTPAPAPGPAIDLPDDSEVGRWIKSKVTEIKGTERSRPLYHFELWLEPPAEVKRRLVGVAYAFSTPAIRPQSQASSDQTSGFRISAGGLACADEITLTLRFDDGSSQKVAVDGCKLLS